MYYIEIPMYFIKNTECYAARTASDAVLAMIDSGSQKFYKIKASYPSEQLERVKFFAQTMGRFIVLSCMSLSFANSHIIVSFIFY